MSRPVGVVVVGAGDMGGRHAHGWVRAGAAVRAIVDPDQARAAALAHAVGAQPSADLTSALGLEGVRAVSVCTPTHLHAAVTVAALERGLKVLCEKPVALTLADAEGMTAAARRGPGEVRIGFMRRFDPAFAVLRANVERIGGPLLAQATLTAGIRPKLLMHDANGNGGPIIDMCCHLFDQWAILFGGRPHGVRAVGYTFGETKTPLASIAHKALDSASIVLDYPGGGVGQIQVSWGLPRGIAHDERHTYIGPEGLVSADWPAAVELHDGAGVHRWISEDADPWDAEIAHTHRWVRGEDPAPLATIDDGTEALRTSLATLTSIAERRAVDLDGDRGDAEAPGLADTGSGA